MDVAVVMTSIPKKGARMKIRVFYQPIDCLHPPIVLNLDLLKSRRRHHRHPLPPPLLPQG